MTYLVLSCLNGSSSLFADNKVNHKSSDDLELCQIQQMTTELAAHECLKNQCLHFFSVAIDLKLFKPADNEEMHTILDVFEFWPDWRTDNRVSCL